MNPKEKQFKDPVHGYISVPVEWCSDFIDTQIFQRLRQIEQTSMRPLYPAAHHDRFIHSLGTFHLARQLYAHLQRNTEDTEILDLLKEDRIKNTFLIACLMHDCGHAPFSHTFEGFYNYTETKSAGRVYELLQEEFPDQDFKIEESFDPAPHEAFSAVVLNQFYKQKMHDYQCDPELAARMITGCIYPSEDNKVISLKNCLIRLLNGKTIDVDKLDYVLRDTWASGVKNASIDIERLLSAATFHICKDGSVQLCFKKSALSVLQNVVEARNYLYEWIYNHHTVKYYSKLLDNSLRKLAKHLATEEDPDCFWNTVFSLEPFYGLASIGEHDKVYLPTDGDMLHLMKKYRTDAILNDVDEFLSHLPKRLPVWKTCAEYRLLFKNHPVFDSLVAKRVAKRLPDLLTKLLGCEKEDVLVASVTSNPSGFKPNQVQILMDDESKPFTDVIGKEQQPNQLIFFYVFVKPEYEDQKEKIINFIRHQTR